MRIRARTDRTLSASGANVFIGCLRDLGAVPGLPPLGADAGAGDRQVHVEPGDRLGRPMPTDRLRGWITAIVITAIGAIVRFQNVGYPIDHGTPVFDENPPFTRRSANT
jgi:hypothetical protein